MIWTHSSLLIIHPSEIWTVCCEGPNWTAERELCSGFCTSRYILRNQMKYFSPWRRYVDRQCVSGWRWMERFIDTEGNLCFFQNTRAVVVKWGRGGAILWTCYLKNGLTGGGDVVTTCRFRDVFVTDDEYRCFSPVLITTHTCSHCAEGTHTFRNTHVF